MGDFDSADFDLADFDCGHAALPVDVPVSYVATLNIPVSLE